MSVRVAARFSHALVQVPHPIIQQSSDFSCGSASLLSVLHYRKGEDLGKIQVEADLWMGLEMNIATGAEPERITAVARKFGLEAHLMLNMTVPHLHECIRRGHSVIIMVEAWAETPTPYAKDLDHAHYIVASGYDPEKTTFMDPAIHTAYGWMLNNDLGVRWHNSDPKGRRQDGLGIIISGGEPIGAFPALPIQIQ